LSFFVAATLAGAIGLAVTAGAAFATGANGVCGMAGRPAARWSIFSFFGAEPAAGAVGFALTPGVTLGTLRDSP
jgi:hypothetical protein